MTEQLTVAYALKQESSGNRLVIEQTAWAAYTGVLTRYAFAKLLKNLIYNEDQDIGLNCGFDGTSYLTVISAYPVPAGLNFTMHLFGGTLGPGQPAEVDKDEVVAIRPDKTSSVDYPVYTLQSIEWIADVYDTELQPVVPKPGLSMNGQDIVVAGNAKVYGTGRVKYTAFCYRYSVSVPEWDDAIENKWQAVAYGTYSGGVSWHELSSPPGSDSYGTDCYGNGQINSPNSPSVPPSSGGDRYKTIDYCTQQVTLDQT